MDDKMYGEWYARWKRACRLAQPYTLKVYVKANKTSCEVEDYRTKTTYIQCDLPFDFNTLKAQIGKATGLKDYELDLFIADHRRRLAGLSTVGAKGQWDYAEPLLLKWFYLLSGHVTQLYEELATQYERLRVEIYTPFADLCAQWGYTCCESTLIFTGENGEENVYSEAFKKLFPIKGIKRVLILP